MLRWLEKCLKIKMIRFNLIIFLIKIQDDFLDRLKRKFIFFGIGFRYASFRSADGDVAACKGFISDLGDPVGDFDLLQFFAEIEGSFSDGSEVFGESDVGEVFAE